MEGRVVRYRLRKRWGTVALVALITGIVGVVVLVPVAGARRTATASERLQRSGLEADALLDASVADPEQWGRIVALPSVADAQQMAYVVVFPGGDLEGRHPVFARSDGTTRADINRGHLIEGRRPDPAAPLEVSLPETTAQDLGLEVGDVLPTTSMSVEATQAMFQGQGGVVADGPELDLEVVGITRTTQEVAGDVGDPAPIILGGAFHEAYVDRIGMNDGLFVVRLEEGATLDTLRQDLEDAFPDATPEVMPGGFRALSLDDSLGVLSSGLLVFAVVAGLFGLAAIGQVVSRTAARRELDQRSLAGIGLSRWGRFVDAWVPLVLAATLGAAGAGVVAAFASGLMPVGLGREAEPDPGIRLDWPVLLGGAVLVLLVVAALGAWSAWRVAARSPWQLAAERRVPRSRAGRLVRRGQPTMAVGLGMVQVTGRQPTAVSVRTAMAGVATAVIGLTAVAVFGASMARLLDEPARSGWGWDVALQQQQQLPPEAAAAFTAAADTEEVEAVATAIFSKTIPVEGGGVLAAMAIDPQRGSIEPVMAGGRAPVAADEVALGADTRRQLGDPESVTVFDAEGEPQQLRVVGTVVVPTLVDPVPLAEGALLSQEGLDQLGFGEVDPDSPDLGAMLLQVRSGSDVEAVLDEAGVPDSTEVRLLPSQSPEVRRLDQVSSLPRVIAAFLVGLAILAVGNALWQTVRRRAHQLGILRACGFDRRQVVGSVTWQATAIGLVGAVVGAPIGVALGRWLWSLVAGDLGVADDPITPRWVLAIVAAAVAASVVAGAPFGVLATRRAPAAALRDE